METPGTRLASARVRKGLKPHDVVKRASISRATLWRYETRGIDRMSVGNLAALCNLYGVSADWILHGDGTMHLRSPAIR